MQRKKGLKILMPVCIPVLINCAIYFKKGE